MSNLLNILTCITNFTAICPILTALNNKDYTTTIAIAFAAFSSAISHLFESHKHNMIGFNVSPGISYLLNRIDISGVVITGMRLLYIWYNSGLGLSLITNNYKIFFIALLVLSTNFLSELDKGYKFYIPIHCFWHLAVFLVINKYLGLMYGKY